MKLLTISAFAFTALMLSSMSNASPSGFLGGFAGVQVNSSNNLLGDILKGFEGLGSSIIDGLKNTTQRGIEDAREFGNTVRNITSVLIRDAAQGGKQIVGEAERNAAHFGAEIESFKLNLILQLEGLRNTVKRKVLTDIQNVLTEVDEDVKDLQQSVSKLRGHLDDDIARESQKLTEQFNIWAASQLERVAVATNGSQEAIDKSEHLINDFINRYTNYLSRNAEAAHADLDIFEKRVQDTIGAYRPIIQTLIERVQECLTSSNGVIASLDCERKARRDLNNLSNVLLDFKSLGDEAASLLNTRFRNRSSVVQTLAEYVLERFAIERGIDVIIEAEVNGEGKGSESGNGNDSGSGSASGSASDSDSDSDSASESGNDSRSDNGSDNGSDSNSGNESESDNSTDSA